MSFIWAYKEHSVILWKKKKTEQKKSKRIRKNPHRCSVRRESTKLPRQKMTEKGQQINAGNLRKAHGCELGSHAVKPEQGEGPTAPL